MTIKACPRKTIQGDRIGGRYMVTASAEYQYSVAEKWRVATFVDQGNSFNTLELPNLKTGVGIGVRWISPVGPIRLDLGPCAGRRWRHSTALFHGARAVKRGLKITLLADSRAADAGGPDPGHGAGHGDRQPLGARVRAGFDAWTISRVAWVGNGAPTMCCGSKTPAGLNWIR